MFEKYLIQDAALLMFGAMVVVISLWIYSQSLFITIMTALAIVFSLGISYFMYTLIFGLNFFPFMNLLASVVAIGKYDYACDMFVKHRLQSIV